MHSLLEAGLFCRLIGGSGSVADERIVLQLCQRDCRSTKAKAASLDTPARPFAILSPYCTPCIVARRRWRGDRTLCQDVAVHCLLGSLVSRLILAPLSGNPR
jgi:hypothetical protein